MEEGPRVGAVEEREREAEESSYSVLVPAVVALLEYKGLIPFDAEVIEAWMQERAEVLAHRDIDDIHRAVDYLNLTTHWAQSRATDEQLEAVTDALLLAMHDLRSVLVRKKADRLIKSD